jgi:hypothetical protein
MMSLAGFVGEGILVALVPLLVPGVVIRLLSRVTQ